MGLLNSPSASAEIEGEESEMVCVDAPIAPERDLIAMLKQTRAIPNDLNHLQLKSLFISVDEERKVSIDSNSPLTNDHIRELLNKYQGEEESKCILQIFLFSLAFSLCIYIWQKKTNLYARRISQSKKPIRVARVIW